MKNNKRAGANEMQAVRYVEKHNNDVEILRLKKYQGLSDPEEAQRMLSNYQFLNGGWYYEDDETQTLSLGASTLWLRVLLELGLQNTEIVHRTANFITGHQNEDGSWYELREKLERSPQVWLSEDEEDNRLWFTISTTVFLTACGYGDSPAVARARDFLLRFWDDHGRFKDNWYPYWAGIPFFARTRGTSSKAFKSCYDFAMEKLDLCNSFLLGWLLTMCRLAELPGTDSLVEATLDRLESMQRPDGAWGSKYGDSYNTLFVLNHLKQYGRLRS